MAKEHTQFIGFRLNKTLIQRIKELMLHYPEIYTSKSQVVRSAVNKLYEWKIKKIKEGVDGTNQ